MPNGNEAKPNGNKWAIMGGIALNVEYTRKYGFEATAAARVTARLVAIPPPVAFQEAIQADIAGRQRRAALAATPSTTPERLTPLVLPPFHPAGELPGEDGELSWVDDAEVLSLLVPDAAGVEYILDDGVAPPSSGWVGEDGVLIHPISPQSERAVIRFATRSEPVVVLFDRSAEDEIGDFETDFETAEDLFGFNQVDEADPGAEEDDLDDEALNEAWLEDEDDEPDEEDEQTVEEIVELLWEDETPTLSLMVPDKANQSYTLDDGVNLPSDGVVSADGLLIHPVSPAATGASLKFADETEAIQISFAAE